MQLEEELELTEYISNIPGIFATDFKVLCWITSRNGNRYQAFLSMFSYLRLYALGEDVVVVL